MARGTSGTGGGTAHSVVPWRSRIVGEGEEAPDQLLANPQNWRLHPKAQQDALAGVLSEVGWVQRCLVNQRTGHVVDGHARIALAISRGEPTVPVVYVDLSPEEEAKVLATFDPIGALAGADREALAGLLADVHTQDAALESLLVEVAHGAGIEYGQPLPSVEAPEPEWDRAAALEAKWETALGQTWVIPSVRVPGRAHRLLCGDATVAAHVAHLLGGAVPALMVTDPPYGVDYDPAWRNEAAATGHLAYAPSRIGQFVGDHRVDWSDAWRLFPGDVVYAWSPPGDHLLITGLAVQDAGYAIRAQIIWRKPHFPISRGHYTYQHEPCWYAIKRGRTAHWVGAATASTVWDIALDRNVEGGHSTQKPLECMARPMRNHEGDVYDPFLGSGTTMCAAEQLGRVCYGMEIEPKYAAVTLERLAQMGLTPRLEEGSHGRQEATQEASA